MKRTLLSRVVATSYNLVELEDYSLVELGHFNNLAGSPIEEKIYRFTINESNVVVSIEPTEYPTTKQLIPCLRNAINFVKQNPDNHYQGCVHRCLVGVTLANWLGIDLVEITSLSIRELNQYNDRILGQYPDLAQQDPHYGLFNALLSIILDRRTGDPLYEIYGTARENEALQKAEEFLENYGKENDSHTK
jgi:hypothetical protein